MIELQTYLHKHGLAKLEEEFFIKSKRHKEFPNLVLLKYSQIDSPMAELIVQQCRGIILDEDKDWAIVVRGYDKFFNQAEGHAAIIDWTTAKVLEKYDGSLVILAFYNNEWRVSTSGTPDASGNVSITNQTFAQLFWKTWNELGYNLPAEQHKTKSFIFELMTPFNRVVVPHKTSTLVLHGVRDNVNLKEEDPNNYKDIYNWKQVKQYPLATWDEILEASIHLDPMESEGYVVRDGNFNRIKLKTPQYVAISHLKDGLSTKKILEIIVANKSDEFLAYFNELTEIFTSLKSSYNNLVEEAEILYEANKNIKDQKEFALAVKDSRVGSACFALRKGYSKTARDFYSSLGGERVSKILKPENVF